VGKICIKSTASAVFVNELNETDSDESNQYETDPDEANEYSVDEAIKEERDQKHFFLRLMTFSLRYDRSGDLTTGSSR
jgi:hypothetical protein